MANVEVTLQDGFKIGVKGAEKVHKDAELREPDMGQVIDAMAASERVVPTPDGYQLVMSNALMGLHLLCRQIVRIGEHQGPFTMDELKRLSPRDVNTLQAEAMRLESAGAAALEVSHQRGRAD